MPKAPKGWRKVGYLIPEVIDPPENICVCVPVPKDARHIQAFLGQLTELSKWLTWEKDGTNSAAQAARRWFDITECVAKEIDDIMSGNCGCGCDDSNPTSGRINANGDFEQFNPNTGEWEVNNTDDPRFNGITYPPIQGANGDVKKCKAANSLTTAIKAEQEAQLALKTAGATLTELVAGVVQFLVGISVITGGISAVMAVVTTIAAAFVANLIASEFESAFTEETWDEFLCLAFCAMEDDGSFSHSGYGTLMARCITEIGGTAGDWLQKMVISMGTTGLTNAARSGRAGTRSCDGCDCCPTVTVPGNWLNSGDGLDTGFDYTSGQSVTFTASGIWNIAQDGDTDADGSTITVGTAIMPAEGVGKLIGRIGTSGTWFAIGVSATIVMPATGRLYLIANDIPDEAAYGPNTGQQSVQMCTD